MIARLIFPTVFVAIVAAAIIAVTSSGGDPYRVNLHLTTATGLRQGSQVKIGGVPAGTVKALELDGSDDVVAELEIDHDKGAIGRNASVRIVTSNLLGSKFVALDPGDATRAALPSGSTIPASRVSYPVDLDQVLNVLDPDTRTRLQVLVNEAGTAITGRRADFNQTLKLLHPSLQDGAKMLAALNSDNTALSRLVARSSTLVNQVSGERGQLVRVVDSAGHVLHTTAVNQAALRATLQRAPATLAQATRFLADLKATTVPLGPAARAISATAPALTDTLAQLPAFQRAARPALRQATSVAPLLTKLATGATPVLRAAKPTLSALASFASAAAPVSNVLRLSIDDALGLVEGWARSIQTRDRLGHVFRGRAVVGLETLRSLVARLVPQTKKQTKAGDKQQPSKPILKLPPLKAPASSQDKPAPNKLLPTVTDIVGGLLGGKSQSQPQPDNANPVKKLLGFLLGP